MITDNIKFCNTYYPLHPRFEAGFNFIKDFMENPKEDGRYEIDGDNIFSLVQSYNSKENARVESHKDYIDIQFVVSGKEQMYYASIDKLSIEEALDVEKDVIFYADYENVSGIECYEGDFTIFFPNDGHKPGMKIDESVAVKKIVVKILEK